MNSSKIRHAGCDVGYSLEDIKVNPVAARCFKTGKLDQAGLRGFHFNEVNSPFQTLRL
jgi:hypothetical protein